VTQLIFSPLVPKQLNLYLEGVRARVSGNTIVAAQSAFADACIKKLQTYPPARANSRYRRTGLLGRSWQRIGPYNQGGNIVVGIGNAAQYASQVEGYVSQDPKQMDSFASWGWPSIEEVRNEYYETLRQATIDALQGRG
jgi:Bacteriophage HK97-gp10, putative tail-component